MIGKRLRPQFLAGWFQDARQSATFLAAGVKGRRGGGPCCANKKQNAVKFFTI
jgi:hypothetical protein